jgi:hypothetical protein
VEEGGKQRHELEPVGEPVRPLQGGERRRRGKDLGRHSPRSADRSRQQGLTSRQEGSAIWQEGRATWQEGPATRQEASATWQGGPAPWQEGPAIWHEGPATRQEASALWQEGPALWPEGRATSSEGPVRRQEGCTRTGAPLGGGGRRGAPLDEPRALLLEHGSPEAPASSAQVAQLVEHVTENHGVTGSIPVLGTI